MPAPEDLFHNCTTQRRLASAMFEDALRTSKEAAATSARAAEMMANAVAARAHEAGHDRPLAVAVAGACAAMHVEDADEHLLLEAQVRREAGGGAIRRAHKLCAESRRLVALVARNGVVAPEDRYRPTPPDAHTP
jgi:hypothetical protein